MFLSLTNENSRSSKVNGFPPPVHSVPPKPLSSPHRPLSSVTTRSVKPPDQANGLPMSPGLRFMWQWKTCFWCGGEVSWDTGMSHIWLYVCAKIEADGTHRCFQFKRLSGSSSPLCPETSSNLSLNHPQRGKENSYHWQKWVFTHNLPIHPPTHPLIRPFIPSFILMFKKALAEPLQIQQYARMRSISSCNLHWEPLLRWMGLHYRRQKGMIFRRGDK